MPHKDFSYRYESMADFADAVNENGHGKYVWQPALNQRLFPIFIFDNDLSQIRFTGFYSKCDKLAFRINEK